MTAEVNHTQTKRKAIRQYSAYNRLQQNTTLSLHCDRRTPVAAPTQQLSAYGYYTESERTGRLFGRCYRWMDAHELNKQIQLLIRNYSNATFTWTLSTPKAKCSKTGSSEDTQHTTTLTYWLYKSTCNTHINIYSNYGHVTDAYCAYSTPIASVRFHDLLFIRATNDRFIFTHNWRRQVVQRNTFHRNADWSTRNVNCFAGVPCGEVYHYVNLGSIELAIQHYNYAKLGLSYIYRLLVQTKTSAY